MCLVKCLNEVLFWSFYYCVAFVFCWLLHLQNSIFLILLPLFAFFVLDFSSVSLFWPPAMVFQFFRRIESMVRLVRCFRRGSIIFIMYAFMVFHVHGWVCFCLCCPWLTLHLFILCMLVFRFSPYFTGFFPCFANFVLCSLFFWGHFGGPVVCFQQFAVSFYFQQIFVIVVLLFPLLIKSFRSSGILIDQALLCNLYFHFALVSA